MRLKRITWRREVVQRHRLFVIIPGLLARVVADVGVFHGAAEVNQCACGCEKCGGAIGFEFTYGEASPAQTHATTVARQ